VVVVLAVDCAAELGPGVRADDPVHRQAVLALVVADRAVGLLAEDPVDDDVEAGRLQSAVWICSTPGPVSPRRTLSLGLDTTRGAAVVAVAPAVVVALAPVGARRRRLGGHRGGIVVARVAVVAATEPGVDVAGRRDGRRDGGRAVGRPRRRRRRSPARTTSAVPQAAEMVSRRFMCRTYCGGAIPTMARRTSADVCHVAVVNDVDVPEVGVGSRRDRSPCSTGGRTGAACSLDGGPERAGDTVEEPCRREVHKVLGMSFWSFI
jgi:hypothetical protein